MARAKYQVLVIPYKKNDNDILYCIFKRSDMDECWQFITGAGENEDKTPLVSAQREAFEKAGISSRMPRKSNSTPLFRHNGHHSRIRCYDADGRYAGMI